MVGGWLVACANVSALTADGSARSVVVPVVAQTASYASRLHVLNVDGAASSVAVHYFGAPGTATPGPRACGALSLAPLATANVDVAVQCGLGPGSHFGMLRLEGSGYTSAYSRVSNPQGNGFSVEGMPAANFFGAQLNVLGLRKSATSPGYGTNCFVASLDEPANYTLTLFDAFGAKLGDVLSGTVQANQLVRLSDVFLLAGITATEIADVRAELHSTDLNKPALIGFCTVQNNTNFDADFRIGKPRMGAGARAVKRRTIASSRPFTAHVTHRYAAVLRAPDTIACAIDPSVASDLRIRLVSPSGTSVAGGSAATSFSHVLGPRSATAGGQNAIWHIEITPSPQAQPFPIAYSFRCEAGNGMTLPLQVRDGATAF